MKIKVIHNMIEYNLDTNNVYDISIPYNFNGNQPSFYNVNKGQLKYLESDGLIYSVQNGASCNVPEVNFNIHCTGTHTEFVGHILKDSGDIGMLLKDLMIPAILITVNPVVFTSSNDTYHVDVNDDEYVITKDLIKNKFINWLNYEPQALIIRTQPNPINKRFYEYKQNVPFFTNDALEYIVGKNISHLIVDLPSIDRMKDGGQLKNHRIFWSNSDKLNFEININSKNTITELSYIPDEIVDGFYFINIQLPHFVCDAAPSRPLLYKID